MSNKLSTSTGNGAGVELVAARGGAASVFSVPPADAGTEKQPTSNNTANNFFIDRLLSFEIVEQENYTIALNSSDELDRLRQSGCFAQAAEFCKARLSECDDADQTLRWSANLAVTYRDRGDYEQARIIHLTTRPLATLTSNDTFAGNHYNGWGRTLDGLGGDTGEILAAYQAAISHYMRAGHVRHLASSENNAALIHIRLRNFSEAHELLDSARARWKQLGLLNLVAQADETRARAYLAEGRLTEARECANASVAALEGGEDMRALAVSIGTLREVLTLIEGRIAHVHAS